VLDHVDVVMHLLPVKVLSMGVAQDGGHNEGHSQRCNIPSKHGVVLAQIVYVDLLKLNLADHEPADDGSNLASGGACMKCGTLMP
jgi:hypothetical protein